MKIPIQVTHSRKNAHNVSGIGICLKQVFLHGFVVEFIWKGLEQDSCFSYINEYAVTPITHSIF